jgi:hypothetical protein
MLEEPVWIFTIPAVGGPARGLDIGNPVRVRPQDAKIRLRMHCASSNLDVVRLLDYAASVSPIALKLKYEILKCGAFFNFFL